MLFVLVIIMNPAVHKLLVMLIKAVPGGSLCMQNDVEAMLAVAVFVIMLSGMPQVRGYKVFLAASLETNRIQKFDKLLPHRLGFGVFRRRHVWYRLI